MDNVHRPGIRSRDQSCHTHHPSSVDTVYAMFTSRATNTGVSMPPHPSSHLHRAPKRTGTVGSDHTSPLSIKLARNTATTCWLPSSKHQSHALELHQSTCLNLNTSSQDGSESDLWILPDFDDWELDGEVPHQVTLKAESDEWAPLLRRASRSNRERLRARLEGDGWAFVGGKYGEDEDAVQDAGDQSEESVDDEFDVVVLGVGSNS